MTKAKRFSTMAEKAAILKLLEKHLVKSPGEGTYHHYEDPTINDFAIARMANQQMNTLGLNSKHVAYVRTSVFGKFPGGRGGSNNVAEFQEKLEHLEARIARLEKALI